MRNFTILSATAVAVAMSGAALAQQDPLEAAVNSRQAQMSLHGFYLGILGGMARGDTEYDAEAATAAADNLAAVGSIDHRFYWPEGTSTEEFEETRALPTIWENPDAFQERIAQLGEATSGLAAEAGGGLEALQAGMGAVGDACGGCHEDFRQPNN